MVEFPMDGPLFSVAALTFDGHFLQRLKSPFIQCIAKEEIFS